MSGDEVFAGIVCTVAALAFWGTWYAALWKVTNWSAPPLARSPLALTPILCALGIYAVLSTIASSDVVDDPRYIFMYLIMGVAWVGVAIRCTPLLGISSRLDALERGNRAASATVIGAMFGLAACFAGGNIGSGPGWWVVVACGVLATLGLFGLWLGMELLTRVSEAVCVERDHASGIRLAGFLAAEGLILGRAVAGDWHSLEATVRDFAAWGWPSLPLLAAAILIQRLYASDRSLLPARVTACLYVALAAGYVWSSRAALWQGMPQ